MTRGSVTRWQPSSRIDELDAQLRRRDDDLEGARQANRELMAELNRPRARP